MSDDEDDYLSDKFLLAASTPAASSSKTYSERRKEAARVAALKNAQNRSKTRRERELESRQEGLSRSLLDRAEEDPAQSKALNMMMRMGFKPGQSLGRTEESVAKEEEPDTPPAKVEDEAGDKVAGAGIGFHGARDGGGGGHAEPSFRAESKKPQTGHIVEPLPVNEWAGKKGIGLGAKRAASPGAGERIAKMARMAEQRDHASFRDRARREYEERRAHGRLAPAQRTCATLDEKAGREFNVLWLNPESPDTFPDGLLDALDDPLLQQTIQRQQTDRSIEGRLRARMRADALGPLSAALDDVDAEPVPGTDKPDLRKAAYSDEEIEEVVQFLRLEAQDRLSLVLDYLRRRYAYCFWCGTQYEDEEDMGSSCPGPTEDDHD